MTKGRDMLGEIANTHRHDNGVLHSHDPAEHSAEEAAEIAARDKRVRAEVEQARARSVPRADANRGIESSEPHRKEINTNAPFALTDEQGRREAGAAFIAMANINSSAERWAGPGDMPGKTAVYAMGGMVVKRDWQSLASALAGVFDAFSRSSPRVASFIESDARINAILATQIGVPFGPSQKSGSHALENKIAAFYGGFRDEFVWICRHTIAAEPGQNRISPSSIQERVRRDAVSEWLRAFVLFDRAIIEANRRPD
jgi:hypothetical protein